MSILEDCTWATHAAKQELFQLRRIEQAALAVWREPSWGAEYQSDIELEHALLAAGHQKP